MAVNWLYFTSTGSVLVIFALFLSSNGILGADTLRVILLNLLGGALLTAGSIGNSIGEMIYLQSQKSSFQRLAVSSAWLFGVCW